MIKQVTSILKLLFVLFSPVGLIAQSQTYNGTVVDDSGQPIVGANVIIQNTSNVASTGINGEFSIQADQGQVLEVSFIGYESVYQTLGTEVSISIKLREGQVLEEVALVGSRGKPRTKVESPVAIDIISTKELALTTAKPDIGQMLTFNTPSFNAANLPASDATGHVNPSELRNLGSSRTLVLINGKRKNQSALVYVYPTSSRGEVAIDMQSIPASAIERIEVLRDGAAAQYGSDAIAGVINVILKKDTGKVNVNIGGGLYADNEGRKSGEKGEYYDMNINYGFKLGEKGFIHATYEYMNQNEALTTPKVDLAAQRKFTGGGAPFFYSEKYLKEHPDGELKVGNGAMVSNAMYVNGEYGLNENATLYASGGFVFRKSKNFALNREFDSEWGKGFFTGLTRSDKDVLFGKGSDHMQATFEPFIRDINFSGGLKGKNDSWNYDLSFTYGSNVMDTHVNESNNTSLGNKTPRNFYTGTLGYNQMVNNFDVSRTLYETFDANGKVSTALVLAMGTEFRTENYFQKKGHPTSYSGGGTTSFAGTTPEQELDQSRYSFGQYVDLSFDLGPLFLGAAIRHEDYSDFGNNLSWKVNGKFTVVKDLLSLRASVSTGFRAPSLQQQYFSKVQTTVSGGGLSNSGTFRNDATELRPFNVPKLKEETSLGYTVGISSKINPNFTITVDAYMTDVDDRVILSNDIKLTAKGASQELQDISKKFGVTSMAFFMNGVDTRTKGIDLVANYKNIHLGPGKLNVNLAANVNETSIEGEVQSTAELKKAGISDILGIRYKGFLTDARPKVKGSVGLGYKLQGFTFTLNNTYFGEVKEIYEKHNQKIDAAVITDFSVMYSITDNLSFTIGADNLLNIYPEASDVRLDDTSLGGVFKYPVAIATYGTYGIKTWGKLSYSF